MEFQTIILILLIFYVLQFITRYNPRCQKCHGCPCKKIEKCNLCGKCPGCHNCPKCPGCVLVKDK